MISKLSFVKLQKKREMGYTVLLIKPAKGSNLCKCDASNEEYQNDFTLAGRHAAHYANSRRISKRGKVWVREKAVRVLCRMASGKLWSCSNAGPGRLLSGSNSCRHLSAYSTKRTPKGAYLIWSRERSIHSWWLRCLSIHDGSSV